MKAWDRGHLPGMTSVPSTHEPEGGTRLWATFRREDGSAAWSAPTDLGPVTAKGGVWPRPTIELVTPARARIGAGAPSRTVQSDGKLAAGAP